MRSRAVTALTALGFTLTAQIGIATAVSAQPGRCRDGPTLQQHRRHRRQIRPDPTRRPQQRGYDRTEQWRLITNLLDPTRYPAAELADLYHRRWQVETAYFSIKATMLDGRVLRSRSIDGLDQEVYALLTACQALIRAGDDALTGRPEVPMERISFTVLLAAATDTVTAGQGIFPGTRIDLVGTIGHAALCDLLPTHRRQRVKARTRKNPTSKYGPNAGQHPQKAQNYTVRTTVAFFEHGLKSRSLR